MGNNLNHAAYMKRQAELIVRYWHHLLKLGIAVDLDTAAGAFIAKYAALVRAHATANN